ncbi:MAG: hypothetical protein ACP6IS_08360 [Candidatus Asgardarchaeia archaeon]
MGLTNKKILFSIFFIMLTITIFTLIPSNNSFLQLEQYKVKGNYIAIIRCGGGLSGDSVNEQRVFRSLSSDVSTFGKYRNIQSIKGGRDLYFDFMFQAAAGYNLIYSSNNSISETASKNDLNDILKAPHKIAFNYVNKSIVIIGDNKTILAYTKIDQNVAVTELNNSQGIISSVQYSFNYDATSDSFIMPVFMLNGTNGYLERIYLKFNDTLTIKFTAEWNISFWQKYTPHDEPQFHSFIGNETVGKIIIKKLSYYVFNLTLEFNDHYQGPIRVYTKHNVLSFISIQLTIKASFVIAVLGVESIPERAMKLNLHFSFI